VVGETMVVGERVVAGETPGGDSRTSEASAIQSPQQPAESAESPGQLTGPVKTEQSGDSSEHSDMLTMGKTEDPSKTTPSIQPSAQDPSTSGGGGGWGGWGGWGGSLWSSVSTVAESAQSAIGQKVSCVV
jgi:hypothetical protein